MSIYENTWTRERHEAEDVERREAEESALDWELDRARYWDGFGTLAVVGEDTGPVDTDQPDEFLGEAA